MQSKDSGKDIIVLLLLPDLFSLLVKEFKSTLMQNEIATSFARIANYQNLNEHSYINFHCKSEISSRWSITKDEIPKNQSENHGRGQFCFFSLMIFH